MSPELLFAVGTLLSWIGWACAARAVIAGCQIAFKIPGISVPRTQRSLFLSAFAAAVLLLVSMPLTAGTKFEGDVRFPLVWFVMPFAAWLTVAGIGMIGYRITQGFFAISPEEKKARLMSSIGWILAAIAGVVLYKMDPDAKIVILKGGVPFSWTSAAVVLLLAIAAVAAMVYSARAVATRGVAKGVVTHIALIIGSIIFGLPFVYLLTTSFKEDIDMASPNGIVWIPRVQETVPYMNPQNPTYQGTYNGQTIKGSVLQKLENGMVRVDISEPLSIRGKTFDTQFSTLKEVPTDAPLVTAVLDGTPIKGKVVQNMDDGRKRVEVMEPANLAGRQQVFNASDTKAIRHVGLRWQNYTEALSLLPPETKGGLVYLQNTLTLVILSMIGTLLSSSIVAYAFSRLRFPGRDAIFAVLLSTMMLPGAVTLMPQFLIFRYLGWIDTLYPLWVPSFFASAFNVFLLRQFFMGIPMELEDAAKIDGCTYLKAFWSVMLPQIKPALAVIAIWTFMGAWNNFMGPLIYVNSPEHMPLSYALQLFQGDQGGEPGLLMAFATMTMLPVLALFFFAQKYFIEGVTLSGFGGR